MAGSGLVVASITVIVASLASLAVSVVVAVIVAVIVSAVVSVVVSVVVVVGTTRCRSVLCVSVGERVVVISIPASVDS